MEQGSSLDVSIAWPQRVHIKSKLMAELNVFLAKMLNKESHNLIKYIQFSNFKFLINFGRMCIPVLYQH